MAYFFRSSVCILSILHSGARKVAQIPSQLNYFLSDQRGEDPKKFQYKPLHANLFVLHSEEGIICHVTLTDYHLTTVILRSLVSTALILILIYISTNFLHPPFSILPTPSREAPHFPFFPSSPLSKQRVPTQSYLLRKHLL